MDNEENDDVEGHSIRRPTNGNTVVVSNRAPNRRYYCCNCLCLTGLYILLQYTCSIFL